MGRWKLNFDRTPPRRERARGAAEAGGGSSTEEGDQKRGSAEGKREMKGGRESRRL